MLALIHANVIDGTGALPLKDATILIENGCISSVGKGADVPSAANVINLSGKTVIPGLTDAHTHISGSSSFDRPGWNHRRPTYDYSEAREGFLHWGVVNVRDCGNICPDVLEVRDEVRQNKIISPRICTVGPWFQRADGHPALTVGKHAGLETPDNLKASCVLIDETTDVEDEVRRVSAMNVDGIKVFLAHINMETYPLPVPQLEMDKLHRVVSAAHACGKKCICHVDDPDGMYLAACEGVDYIEHAIRVGATNLEISDKLIEMLVQKNIAVDPTIVSVANWDKGQLKSAPVVTEALLRGVKKMYDAGVRLLVGCDSGIPLVPYGESLHQEMALFVQAGIPALDVIHMASLENAKALDLGEISGSVECGKAADLVVLDSDPLKDITATKKIKLVMKDGRIIRDEILGQ